MHNKSYTADNQATIVGGRNIGDEYFGADPVLAFGDLDVLAIGPVVTEVSASFDEYWNSELAYPISVLADRPPTTDEIRQGREALKAYVAEQADSDYMAALSSSALAQTIRNNGMTYDWGEAQVLYDAPEKVLLDRDAVDAHLASDLGPLMRQVREELIIYSPYFVPGKGGVKFFKKLIDEGVRVRVLTNSLASTDVGVVHAGYAKYRRRMLRAGVELYEVNKKLSRAQRKNTASIYGSSTASLHAKSFVLDREKVFIGSLNLDPRSVYENTEIGLVLTSPEIATTMAEQFDQKIGDVAFRLELETNDRGVERIVWHGVENGQPVTYYVDPHTGFWRRFGVAFLSVLPIESQL
jgi:putative cardiolipin synthase